MYICYLLPPACISEDLRGLPEINVHMTDRFLLGGGDQTFRLGLLLSSTRKWLITGAMEAVVLVTKFRALMTGSVRPFTLGLISTVIIAVLDVAYASSYRATKMHAPNAKVMS